MKNAIETGLHPQGSHLHRSRLNDKRRYFCMPALVIHRVHDAGQSLVEFALTMPLFILILVGTAELARFAWASIEASNAARAGVQFGAQTHTTASDTNGIQAAALNDATNLSGLTATSSHTCFCSTAASTTIDCPTALTSCPAPATIIEYVQVNTSAQVTPLINYPGLPTPFTVQGSAIMEVGQ
jgi:Flp pilus assembly protein TadG